MGEKLGIIEATIEVSCGTENFIAGIYLIENKNSPGNLGAFLPVGWIPKTKKGFVSNWKKLGDVGGPSDNPWQWWQGLSELITDDIDKEQG